jgi:ABC-type Na+ efflux pump permease subunit
MKWSHIWAIARKDWREVRQNTSAWLSMLIVPLVFVVIFPLAILLGSNIPAVANSTLNDPDIQTFFANMPPAMQAYTAGLDTLQAGMVMMLGFFFAPFFLIMPIMFSAVIAAETFAGEMERKTLEALLYTPVSDSELFLGKVVAAGVPALLVTWVSFLLYGLINNIAGWSMMGRIWFPLPTWYPLVFWVSPALAALGIGATVLISAKTKTFMGAYQTSGSLVLLVLALMAGQATGVLYLSVGVGMVIGLVFWVVAAVLMWLAIKKFNRRTILVAGD